MKTESVPQCLVESRTNPAEDIRDSRNLILSPAGFSNHRNGFNIDRVLLTLVFKLQDAKTVGFSHVLKLFEGLGVRISHVESRAAQNGKAGTDDLDFFIQCELPSAGINPLVNSLRRVAEDVSIIREENVPWFPRRIRDLDGCQRLLTKFEPTFDEDHPGYRDLEYRERRSQIARLALSYKQGEPLPRVEYTVEETAIWKEVYTKLTTLYPSHACKQFVDAFHILEKLCGYRADNIPQLQDVSTFLQGRTGFRLRPVAGLLSARDFLASLAFRVFQCTQYMRHPASPMHSPEPDCCHELLGHVPMLADKEFAQFSQELGLASLGASDEDIEKLSTPIHVKIHHIVPSEMISSLLVYNRVWLCKQNGSLKAYGAGLLSSYGELMYSLSGKPQYKSFDPEVTALQIYQDHTYQPAYFVSESFEDAKSKLWIYASKIRRPFSLRYDPLTCSVEILDKPHKVKDALAQVREDLRNLCSALNKLP